MIRFPAWIVIMLLGILLAACEPAAGSERGFAYIWYVALTGSDANTCDAPTQPCLTVEGALSKARTTNTRVIAAYSGETVSLFHTINVAAGTYMVTGLHEGYPFARVDINASIIGEGEGSTIFDAANLYGGVFINGDVSASLRDLTIRNVLGNAPDSCVNIRGAAVVTIEDVTVRHCEKSGITHLGTSELTLNNVTATEGLVNVGGNGNGLTALGPVVVNGGSYSGNQGWGIGSHVSLTATGVTVDSNGREGIVIVNGSASLTDLQITNNGQDGSFRTGLSLMNEADVTVQSSQINNNQYGIWQHAGELRLIDTMISGNPRTAILIDAGVMRFSDTIVEGNGSAYVGTGLPGALAVESGARAIVRESLFAGNLNGGIVNGGELFFLDSELSDHSGGMPALFNEETGTTIIERSLIARNAGGENIITGGTAIENRGVMTLVNTTVSGNLGAQGLSTSGSLNLAFSTVAFNVGTGFVSSESSTDSPWLANNVIAGNGTDCYEPRSASAPGALTLAGNNIDSDGTCGFDETYALADLHIDPLADNGGPTHTHALLTGSPAIDTASGSCPPNDQRSLARPFGAACDTGAYETGSTIMRISDEGFSFATPTPGGGQPTLIVTIETGCFFGPGLDWPRYSNLSAGTQAEIVGRGFGIDWLVIKHPTIANTNCWIAIEDVEFDIPLDQLRFISVPPKPTATPSPTPEKREPTACPTNPQIPGTCQ